MKLLILVVVIALATALCGDGKVDAGNTEACDDGNFLTDDGCAIDCTVETGWTCSGGSTAESSKCVFLTGDGIMVSYEECDDGNDKSEDGCSDISEVESDHKCTNDITQNPVSNCEQTVFILDKVLVNICGAIIYLLIIALIVSSYLIKAKVCSAVW
jgi:cysteine-rich repeat protein